MKVKDYNDAWHTYRRGGQYTDGPKPAILDVFPTGQLFVVTENNFRTIPDKIIVGVRVLEKVAAEKQRQGATVPLTTRLDEYLLEE